MSDGHAASPQATPSLPKFRRLRGKRGSLANMPSMPLDILLEIFFFLQPQDLLCLARTNKDIRDFLMRRSSSYVWKISFKNIPDLPSCPGDLDLPVYTSLLFDRHCFNCLKPNSGIVYWECRTRLCKPCKHTKWDQVILALIMRCSSTNIKTYASISTVLGVNLQPQGNVWSDDRAINILGKLEDIDGSPLWHSSYAIYIPHLERAQIACQTMTAETARQYIESLKEHMRDIREPLDELKVWYRNLRETRSVEIESLRDERRQAIYAKLDELGWGAEVNFMSWSQKYAFGNTPEVKKAQLLTPRVWKNIEKAVIKFMTEVRTERLLLFKPGAISARMMTLQTTIDALFPPYIAGIPSAFEVSVGVPEVKDLVQTTPFDIEMEPENFAGLHSHIRDYVDQRRIDGRRYFDRILLEELDLEHSSIDPSTLAAGAWFSCEGCGTSCAFPEVLEHDCELRQIFSIPLDDNAKMEWYQLTHNDETEWRTWTPESMSKAIPVLQCIIRAHGMDPCTATIDQLDATEIRITCTVHYIHDQHIRTVMNWRAAFGHHDVDCRWTRVPEPEASLARQLEPAANALALRALEECETGYTCCHCRCRNRKALIFVHLREAHGIDMPTAQDCCATPDSVIFPGPVYLVSERHQENLSPEVAYLFIDGVAAFYDLEGSSLQLPTSYAQEVTHPHYA